MELERMLQHLLWLTDDTIIREAISNDRIGYKLSLDEIEQKGRMAKNLGIRLAEKYQQLVEPPTVEALADYLGVQIEEQEIGVDKSFATLGYFETPNKIVVNTLFKEKDSYFAEHNLEQWQFKEWRDVIIAHELFHSIQEHEQLDLQDFQIKLWGIGRYQHMSTINALVEIAANSFAKKWLNLDYYPGILDKIVLYPYFPEEIASSIQTDLQK